MLVNQSQEVYRSICHTRHNHKPFIFISMFQFGFWGCFSIYGAEHLQSNLKCRVLAQNFIFLLLSFLLLHSGKIRAMPFKYPYWYVGTNNPKVTFSLHLRSNHRRFLPSRFLTRDRSDGVWEELAEMRRRSLVVKSSAVSRWYHLHEEVSRVQQGWI